ncbi:MAG: glutathione S-transferase N-terminal domain-containing protein [Candidatus Gastranaerophilaceae bacterium]
MLLLYKMDGCPYCEKVLKHLEEKQLQFRSLDISDPVNLDELLHLGGEEQVPFLVDTEHNAKMYESEEIIQYVDTL